MTDYTPTTEEVRESFASGVNFESRTPFLSGRKQFDRWLAAHDAEKDLEIARQADIIALLREDEAELHRLRTAGVVAEEPEWEYGVEVAGIDGTWPRGPREDALATIGAHAQQGRAAWLMKRVKAIPAGPWVPVES